MATRIIVHNIRSMFNTGALFRNADAFGVEHVYLTGYTASPPREEIQKTALGAQEAVAWSHHADVEELISNLKRDNWSIIAFESGARHIPLTDWKAPDRSVVLFGNEPDGIPDALLALADHVVAIPMLGTKSSINVAVASGVALWEIARQNSK